MHDNFDACLADVLAQEGGFADDPRDPGGATNLGITLRVWSRWIGHTATIAEIEALTRADVRPIYLADYWNLISCDDWPKGVDLIIFDSAVNQGPGRAVRTLQRCTGSFEDGKVGPATRAAVAAVAPKTLISDIAAIRDQQYRADPEFGVFGDDWLRRVSQIEASALAMAGSA